MAFDERGAIHVQWRNSLGGHRDMYAARSDDGGRTFGEATKLGRGTWPLAACPMDGGAITARDGSPVAVWRRERTIYVVEGAGGAERAIGTGEQPWIAATGSGPAVAWVASRGGRLLLLAPGADKPRVLADHASDPVLAAGNTPDAPLAAVWEEGSKADTRVMCRVIDAEEPPRPARLGGR